MSVERDGRRVSDVLTDARTVLSRAETAYEANLRRGTRADPALAEVQAALAVAIEALEPFARTSKSGCPNCGAAGKPHRRDKSDPTYHYWRNPWTCEVPRG